jgi:hypothetical protein
MGGIFPVEFTLNYPVYGKTVDIKADEWIHVSSVDATPVPGSESEVVKLSIRVDLNEGAEARPGTIQLTYNGKNLGAPITFTQSGLPALSTSIFKTPSYQEMGYTSIILKWASSESVQADNMVITSSEGSDIVKPIAQADLEAKSLSVEELSSGVTYKAYMGYQGNVVGTITFTTPVKIAGAIEIDNTANL